MKQGPGLDKHQLSFNYFYSYKSACVYPISAIKIPKFLNGNLFKIWDDIIASDGILISLLSNSRWANYFEDLQFS